MISYKLTCLIIFTSIVQYSTQKSVKYPIILVPGYGGSQAYCKLNSSSQPSIFGLWIDLKYFLVPSIWTNYLRANYDPETGTMTDNGVCEVLFPGWGSTETIENLDENPHYITAYYHSLVTYLVEDPFYVRNKTLRGTPFDFRRSPNENKEFFPRMKDLIEETYVNSGNLPVVIVAHSLGSIYSLQFLKRQTGFWKNKYIKAFISAGGPHGGTVKAIKSEVSGDDLGDPIRSGLSFRELLRSMPSTAFLLPDSRLWSPTEPVVITPTVNYSVHDYKKLFKDINFELGYKMMQTTKASIDNFVGPTGIKELYCIHGSGVETASQLIYYPPKFYREAFPNQTPTLVTAEGDGSVPLRSLEVCKQWPGAKHIVIPGAEHVKIIGDSRFIDIVNQVSTRKKLA